MMNRLVGAAVLMGAVGAGAAGAQEFKGAELAAEVLAFDSGDDSTSTNYRGSVEAGLFGGFGVAADLSFFDFGEGGEGVRNVTVHALYDALEFATVGAFYARDATDDADTDTFGIEAGRSFGAAGVEGFLGFGDDDGGDVRLLGLDGTYDVTPRVSVTAAVAALDADGGGLRRISVGGEYRFGDRGPALYAQVGRLDVDDDAGLGDSTNFVGLGARIAIGPNQGTTFESRGLTKIIAGF